MKSLLKVIAFASLFVAAGSVSAQHYHLDSHHHRHAPLHHGSHYGHSAWHHVVPHSSLYIGAYYTAGTTHYYTPSPIVSGSTMVQAQRPVELSFGGYTRYPDLASRLSFVANAVCVDLHYNYRSNSGFSETYAEAYAVFQAAKFVAVQEQAGDRTAIYQRLVEIDRLFHHVQDETRGWIRTPVKQIGPDTLGEKMAAAEAILHHLCFVVGVKPHDQTIESAPPPAISVEVAPPPLSAPLPPKPF